MKQLYFFLAALFLFQFSSLAQQNSHDKIFTKSEDILNAIMKSHNSHKDNDSARTIVTTKILENGYVLESRMGQFWNGTDWDNSSLISYTYTPDGLKTEEIDQFWIEGEWVNSYRYLTSYFINDIVSLYVEQSWNGTDWVNSYEYASLYNNDLHLMKYAVQQWNGAAWDSLYKTTYEYDNSGNLATSIDQNWNGTGWDNQYKNSYQYNSNNDISQRLEEQWIEGSWKNSILDLYSYDAQNQLDLIASFWWPDSVWKESVEIYYDFDSYGNITDKLTKFWESEELGLQNKYHTMYEYLPGTNLDTKVTNQEWNLQSEEWINQYREIKGYDGENNIQNYLTEVWNGSDWQASSQDNYTYDDHGNLDIQLSQNWDGTEWVNSFRATHTWLVVTAVEDDPASLPLAYSLKQNYPNPFNPSTKISYTIAKFSLVQLKIFDVLGNELETLINQEKPAGTYQLIWNAVNFPSGVYFYQIKAGDFIQTKKMILLK